MSICDPLATNRYILIYCPPLYAFVFQVVSSFQHFRPEFYRCFSSLPSVLQASQSYIAVLYHPNNTWWPIIIKKIITYSVIYDHRTIFPASCRSCMSPTLPSCTASSCWPRLTNRLKENLYRLATTAYSLHLGCVPYVKDRLPNTICLHITHRQSPSSPQATIADLNAKKHQLNTVN